MVWIGLFAAWVLLAGLAHSDWAVNCSRPIHGIAFSTLLGRPKSTSKPPSRRAPAVAARRSLLGRRPSQLLLRRKAGEDDINPSSTADAISTALEPAVFPAGILLVASRTGGSLHTYVSPPSRAEAPAPNPPRRRRPWCRSTASSSPPASSPITSAPS
jgi:hypothetical protein